MGYYEGALMADDGDLVRRVAFCAQVEGEASGYQWAADHRLALAAQPEWADAYAYALNAGNQYPGRDDSVITDAMILTAVQAVRG